MKNYLISGVVALIVASGVSIIAPRGVTTVNTLGAVTSPDINSPYFSFGGVREWAGFTQTFAAASTTCSLQSPAATSTLVFGSFRVASTSATAALIEMGKSVSPNATTTLLGQATLAANAQGTMIASTSLSSGIDGAAVFAPNTYFNVKVGSGVFQYGGTCVAVWRQNAY